MPLLFLLYFFPRPSHILRENILVTTNSNMLLTFPMLSYTFTLCAYTPKQYVVYSNVLKVYLNGITLYAIVLLFFS